MCRIPVCCALWCSWPSTSVLIQQAAALQLLADFLQHGMLGVIQVAADLAPGCAGMAAAAQAALDAGLGVNAGHDLNRDNLAAFVREVPGVLEVSIGHALIADALELGYRRTLRNGSFERVLASGAAYLPLDLDYPKERLGLMCDDARPVVILADDSTLAQMPVQPTGRLHLMANDTSPEPSAHSQLGLRSSVEATPHGQ